MKSRVMVLLVALILCAIPMQAGPTPTPTVLAVFKDMSGNDLTKTGTNYNLDVGQQFQAHVWFESTADWQNAELAFRFGTATEVGGSDIENHFIFDWTDTYVNPFVFDDSMDWGDSGSPEESPGICAYADFIELYDSHLHRGGTEYLGVVYTLRNNMALGDSGNISIYTHPDHEAYSYGTSVGGVYAPVKEYTLTTVPEPSSLMAMGCAGVGVLGNLWHRRRKKKSLDA